MGPPVLNEPVLLHSSRMSMCDLTKLTQTQCNWKSQWWRNWYAADWAYGHPIVYFFCTTIIVFTILHWLLLQRHNVRAPHTTTALPGYNKSVAVGRFISNRQFRVGNWYSPPLGVILLISLFGLFYTLLTLVPKPYYWPSQAFGGSPPIATRSGWLALAMLPFLLALSAKRNLITHLTGVSHERLQVFHRWTAWFMYIASLIHTFPFIINNIHQGIMVVSYQTRPWYWTGLACLIPQTWLVFMSFGPIRNSYYEFFKVMHFICGILFVVFLFIHCNFRLTSWDYFIATVILYGISFLARTYKAFIHNGFGFHAELDPLPNSMIKVTIPLPANKSRIHWKPGQHFFIRFLKGGVHQITNHPFTIASVDTSAYPEAKALLAAKDKDKGGKVSKPERELTCYIRCKNGTTGRMGRLIASSQTKSGVGVLLDGPYGGMHGSLRVYDCALLIAGGSGATFISALLQDIAYGFVSGQACRNVHVVWATRTYSSIEWFRSTFEHAIEIAPADAITVSVYVTDEAKDKGEELESDSKGDSQEKFADQSGQDEKEIQEIKGPISDGHGHDHLDGDNKSKHKAILIHRGRPKLPSIMREYTKAKGTVGIAACGPDSLNLDVRNAVSAIELDILRRNPNSAVGAKEVYLHVESFGW